jgi:hypothetical protein
MGPTRIEVAADGTVAPVLAEGEDSVTVRFWHPEHGIQDETLS